MSLSYENLWLVVPLTAVYLMAASVLGRLASGLDRTKNVTSTPAAVFIGLLWPFTVLIVASLVVGKFVRGRSA